MNDRCVYFHSTPDTKEVFYIGMGSLKRAREFNTSRNKHWKSIVEKHGKPIVLIIAENLSVEKAVEIEKFWIKHHGLNRLANISPGGDGILGFAISEETKLKISSTLKGRKLSPETIQKVANALRGRKRSPETVTKIANSNTGKKRSEEAKQNMRIGQLGKSRTQEHRKNIGLALKGTKQNKEHVLKKAELKKDKTMFQFYHSVHGSIVCTKSQLIEKYELGNCGLYAVINGRRKSHKGWSIVPFG